VVWDCLWRCFAVGLERSARTATWSRSASRLTAWWASSATATGSRRLLPFAVATPAAAEPERGSPGGPAARRAVVCPRGHWCGVRGLARDRRCPAHRRAARESVPRGGIPAPFLLAGAARAAGSVDPHRHLAGIIRHVALVALPRTASPHPRASSPPGGRSRTRRIAVGPMTGRRCRPGP